jgi:hypothetical protein
MIKEQRRGLRTWLARITGRPMAAPTTGASMAEPDETAAMEPASMAPDMAAPGMAEPESMEPTTPPMSDPATMRSSAMEP